jgi:hypothetical protein
MQTSSSFRYLHFRPATVMEGINRDVYGFVDISLLETGDCRDLLA